MLNTTQLQLVQEWNEAKEQLKKWQEQESQLRLALIGALFDPTKTEGTESIEVRNDWKLRVTRKLSYNLTNKDDALVNILATLPSVVAQNLIRWKPDLNLAMYRKLDEPTRQLFTPVLTINPAKPSLELVPPNAN